MKYIQWRRSGVFIINFEHILHLALVFLLLTLNMLMPTWNIPQQKFAKSVNKYSFFSLVSQLFIYVSANTKKWQAFSSLKKVMLPVDYNIAIP